MNLKQLSYLFFCHTELVEVFVCNQKRSLRQAQTDIVKFIFFFAFLLQEYQVVRGIWRWFFGQ